MGWSRRARLLMGDVGARVAHRENADQQAGRRDQRGADPDDRARRERRRQRAGGEGCRGHAEVAGRSLKPSASPRRRGPARSIFITTVIDQASPWLTPSSRLAATMNHQEGARPINSGTGSATSQPATSSRLRPIRSASSPAARFVTAFAAPKATTNARIAALERSRSRPCRPGAARSAPARPWRRRARSARRAARTGAFARIPSCTRGVMRARRPRPSGWRRRSAPAPPATAAPRRGARRRTPPDRRARAAGCGRVRSRSRRSGCRTARGHRPSHRNGSDRGRHGPHSSSLSKLACSSRAWPRGSPATCRSGRPTSPISSESPLNTSHGLAAATPVGDRVGVCAGAPRCRDRGHDRVAQLDHVTVLERDMLKCNTGPGGQVAGRAGAFDQAGSPAHGRPHVRLEHRRDRRRSRRPPRRIRRPGRCAGRRPQASRASCSRTGNWHRSRRRSGTA